MKRRNTDGPRCHGGPCDRGRKPCPAPEACQLAADEAAWRWLGGAGVLAAAIVITAAGVVLWSLA